MRRLKNFIKRMIYGKPKPQEGSPYGWFGNYASWNEAAGECAGYDDRAILEKCSASLLKVKNGEALYERDSVIFDEIQYSWPLLAALLHIAIAEKSELNIVDFGGSLGSSYFQNRKFLQPVAQLNWNIVEQKEFVNEGRRLFENEELKFYYSVDEALQRGKPSVLILSSSLQYLSEPHVFIDAMIAKGFQYIITDMMPFNPDAGDRITVQKVPPSIYEASYPCWFLDYNKLLDRFREEYTVLSEHYNDNQISLDGRVIRYCGFFLKKRTT